MLLTFNQTKTLKEAIISRFTSLSLEGELTVQDAEKLLEEILSPSINTNGASLVGLSTTLFKRPPIMGEEDFV